ncbi:hypothetical protein [Dyella sp. 2HG41-7]|uniref:hypothetical protein n=1 Tax=Dyella sp. 2HG41-7 TaxID=2883239 RepID=UPI001F1CA4D3|nr:hypothetical protein [Dyella sp. 2HG41-7]
MTANIIPFPSHARVRMVPIDAEQEYLPPAVRQLLAVMEATERAFGSDMPPKGMSDDDYHRAIAPYLK